MPQTFSSDIFRVATAYEASKDSRTVVPDAAEGVRAQGRARFYDALAGRYGLPGSIFGEGSRDDTARNPVSDYFNLRAMTFNQTDGLADMLRDTGRLDRTDSDLLSYRLGGLSYAGDAVFSTSPVAQFARQMAGARGTDRTTDLIAQQEEQLRYLTENDADPKAIRGRAERADATAPASDRTEPIRPVRLRAGPPFRKGRRVRSFRRGGGHDQPAAFSHRPVLSALIPGTTPKSRRRPSGSRTAAGRGGNV
ncbi:MAG: hypothetical protein JJ881_05060 [Alphaproteobacteria bacterium]|nr:hypothetical protein [Alphaproteobacteria bacterium]